MKLKSFFIDVVMGVVVGLRFMYRRLLVFFNLGMGILDIGVKFGLFLELNVVIRNVGVELNIRF